MFPLNQFKSSFGPHELEVLDLAFDAAWAKLSVSVHDPMTVDVIKDVLRRKIVQVAKAGIKGPDDISALALDCMPPLSATFGGAKVRPERRRRSRERH